MDEEMDVVTLPLMCGNVSGLLHLHLFKCPGIRVPCVEYDGRFITPKDFTYVGNKHTLKDWKTAIRCRGQSLRKMIDCGELDFYNHEDLCTGRCMSRSINTSRGNDYHASLPAQCVEDQQTYTLLKQVKDHSAVEPGDSVAEMMSPLSPATLQHKLLTKSKSKRRLCHQRIVKQEPQDFEDNSAPFEEEDMLEFIPVETATGKTVCMSTNGVKTLIVSDNHSLSASSSRAGKSKYDAAIGQGDSDFQNLADSFPNVDDFLEDSHQFWQSIMKVGLMDSVICEMKKGLDEMRNQWITKQTVSEEEANRMSKAISNLGLTKMLKNKLAEQKTQMLRQNIKLQMEIEDLKRKLAESERKKEENNRKSEAFENLIEMGNKAKSYKLLQAEATSPPPSSPPQPSMFFRVTAATEVAKSSPRKRNVNTGDEDDATADTADVINSGGKHSRIRRLVFKKEEEYDQSDNEQTDHSEVVSD